MSEWREAAACRDEGVHPDWFWPEDGQPHAAAVALHICRIHCQVREECDEWAQGAKLTHPQVAGGRRYTTVGGGHGGARRLAESRITKPSSAGCPFCPPQPPPPPPPIPQLRRADCPECGRNIGLMPWGLLARHQRRPRQSRYAAEPCPGTGGKP